MSRLPGGIEGKPDVAEIRFDDVLKFRNGASGPDANHGAIGIELAVDGFDRLRCLRFLECDVDGRKNTARYRQKMRGEDQLRRGNSRMFEDFRGVAMREQVIRAKVLVNFDEVEVTTWFFACATGTGLAITNDRLVSCQQTGFRKRANGENDAGRIAARVGYELALAISSAKSSGRP